jgi:Flp pilus assembly protein TadG
MNKGVQRHRKGFAVILTTLSLVLLVPMVGLAIDVSVLYMIRAKLSAAVDAAVLAGAQSLANGGDTATQRASAQDAATRFFNANFPTGYWGTTNVTFAPPTIDDTSAVNYRTVSATASATAPLYFLRVFGTDATTIATSAQAGRRDTLVMLVLDRSGSMNNSFQGTTACAIMKQDAAQFVNYFAPGRDMLGLVIFGASSFVYAPTATFNQPDANGNTVASLIGQISCGGNTNTSGAVEQAYNQIQAIGSTTRTNVIVLMTDGRPNGFVGDFTNLRTNPGTCDAAGKPLVGVIAQWAGGPKITGTTAGVMSVLNSTASTSNETPTANSGGCQFAGNLIKMPNDISAIPANDAYGNALAGSYSVNNPNFPYNGSSADLSTVTSPRQIILASTNALDNEGTKIRTNTVLSPSIYTIALEGNDPNDPPDTLLLRKLANDASMESDPDPTAQMFYQQQKGQTTGYFADAPDPSELAAAFNSIATQIVVRLAR